MDDLNKFFSGISMYEKLYSQNNAINSISALSHPLNISNWLQRSDESFTINAIAGNSLKLWESLINIPKVADYNGMSTIMSISHYINNLPKTNPVLDSLSSLSGNMNWLSSFYSHPSLKNETLNWSLQSLAGNSIVELLLKQNRINDITKSRNLWSSLLHPEIVKLKKNKSDITTKIERFADNVASIYSQVENFDEPQKIEFSLTVNEVLTHEANSAKDIPTYFWVLEWVLNKYNEAIESAIFEKNVEDVKKIYDELKTRTFVGWVSLILVMGIGGVIENKGGKLWDSIMGTEDEVKPQIIYNTTISYNATTNSLRPLRIEPDGRTKILCIIPDCTEVQLGEVIGKYVQVTLLQNGTIAKGWCLNKEFTTSKQLP